MKFEKSVKWINLLIALSFAPALTGCTDEELAVGLGAIAIGAGAVAIGEATEHGGHYHCEPGYREICHDFRDYWGNWRHECHSEYDSCFSRHWVSNSLLAGGPMGASKLLTEDKSSGLNGIDWAVTFNISFEAASTLISALEQAKDKDLSAILALGFSRDDVKALGSFTMPSDAGLDAMAKSLNQDAATTRAMIQKILDISIRQRGARPNADGV